MHRYPLILGYRWGVRYTVSMKARGAPILKQVLAESVKRIGLAKDAFGGALWRDPADKKTATVHTVAVLEMVWNLNVIRYDPQHPAQRFSSTPQQLISNRESGEIVWPHLQLSNPAHRNGQRARDCGRR